MAATSGETFQNGETCKGEVVYVDPNGLYETDVIEIDGMYPAENEHYDKWLLNEESEVTIKVLRGRGSVAVRYFNMVQNSEGINVKQQGVHYRHLHVGSGERTVVVPASAYYSWESFGDEPFVVQATFQPPFDPEKYHVVSEDELVNKEAEL